MNYDILKKEVTNILNAAPEHLQYSFGNFRYYLSNLVEYIDVLEKDKRELQMKYDERVQFVNRLVDCYELLEDRRNFETRLQILCTQLLRTDRSLPIDETLRINKIVTEEFFKSFMGDMKNDPH